MVYVQFRSTEDDPEGVHMCKLGTEVSLEVSEFGASIEIAWKPGLNTEIGPRVSLSIWEAGRVADALIMALERCEEITRPDDERDPDAVPPFCGPAAWQQEREF